MVDNLKDAIEHAKEVAENWKSQLVNCISEEGRNKCLECAKEHELLAEWLTELQERREADRWIPVSERLPEINPNTHDFKEVQCTTIWEDVRVYKFGREIGYDTAHFWYGLRIMDEYVVAWKPLSNPYESEDN